MKTALYRHFDKRGNLLYVGISLYPIARLITHTSKSVWAKSIARVEIEYFEHKGHALYAEFLAIRKENPLFNKGSKKIERRRVDEPRIDAFLSRQRADRKKTESVA